MTTQQRKRAHIWLAVFFALQFPVWLWKVYLIFVSIYALVATHLAGASAEIPFEDDDAS